MRGYVLLSDMAQMKEPLQICVVVNERQIGTRALAVLLEGLIGPLAISEVCVAPEIGAQCPGWLTTLVSFERRLLSVEPIPAPPVKTLETGPRPCDVVIDLRASPAPSDLAAEARYGIWQVTCARLGYLAQAVMSGASAVDSAITCRLSGARGPQEIARTRIQTKPLVSLTHDFVFQKTMQLVLHHLRRLAHTGTLPVPQGNDIPNTAAPGPAAMIPYLFGVAQKGIGRARARIRLAKPFVLGVADEGIFEFDPESAIELPRRPGTYCADPFLVHRDDETYVFFEEYPNDTRCGVISVARLSPNGADYLGTAIAPGYHLSFPFLFSVGSELFMLPESLGADRLEVWRCIDFPLGWKRHVARSDAPRLADPVLFCQDEDWWLFGNNSHDTLGDFSSELSLYKVDPPNFTRFDPHPLNPVVVSSETARNAGRVFEHEGRVYRLSQDNSGPDYGYGLNLMEITSLTETDYSEHRVRHITPETIPGAVGIHHADFNGRRVIFDLRKG